MTRANEISKQFIVGGRVQGVGYRRFVQKTALLLGLTGWTRNLLDGRVEVLAKGPENKLLELEESLKRGPTFSQVREFFSKNFENGESADFIIKPDGERPL